MEDEALAAKVARLGCATLVDALGRIHSHPAHIPSMTSPSPDRPLFGPAATTHGTQNLVGALRQSMAALGARTIREMHAVEMVNAPSIATSSQPIVAHSSGVSS